MKRAAVFLTSLMILTVSVFIAPTDAEIVHIGAKASFENELRLVKERLKLKEEIALERVADWRFVRELAGIG